MAMDPYALADVVAEQPLIFAKAIYAVDIRKAADVGVAKCAAITSQHMAPPALDYITFGATLKKDALIKTTNNSIYMAEEE